MAWSIVGVGAVAETTTTTLTLTEPAGVANGDLLVACIASRTTATTAVSNTGWTAVNSQNNNNTLTTSSAVASGTMLYQVRSGTPDLTFVVPAGVSVSMGRIVAYRGSAQTTPLETSTAFTTSTNITAVSGAGLTPTTSGDLIVAMAAGGQEAAWSAFNATTPSGASGASDTTTAPSATWRERADSSTVTGADTSLGVFDAVMTGTGATGNLTATASVAASHVVVAGAFRPSAITVSVTGVEATASIGGTMATITQTGSTLEFAHNTTSASGTVSSSITIPACAAAIISYSGYSGVSARLSGGTVTLGGTTATIGGAGDISTPTWNIVTWYVTSPTAGGSKSLTWNWTGSLVVGTGTWSITFWDGVNTGSPVRDVDAAQSAATSVTSPTLTASSGDLIVAAGGFYSEGGGNFNGWSNLTELIELTPNDVGRSALATGSPSGNTTVGISSISGTNASEACISAIVLKPSVITAAGVSATVQVTGVAATGAVGDVSVVSKANVSVTGVQATGSVGTATAAITVITAVTGVEAAGTVGDVSVAVALNADVPVTGVEASGLVGGVSVAAGGAVSAAVSGVEAVAELGSVTVTTAGGLFVAVTGIQAAGAVGRIGVGAGLAQPDAWDRHRVGPIELSNSDKTATELFGESGQVWSTTGHAAGRYYAEVAFPGDAPNGAVGIYNEESRTGTMLTVDGDVQVTVDGTLVANHVGVFPDLVADDVVGIRADFGAGEIWFRVNGGDWNARPPPPTDYPDASTTGTTGTLTAVPGALTSGTGWHWESAGGYAFVTESDAVLSDLDISGGIYFMTGKTDVAISNVKCRFIWPQEGCHGCIISDCDVGHEVPLGESLIWLTDADNCQVLRCNIHGGENAIVNGGDGTLIEDNYIHDLIIGSVETAHTDGIQLFNGNVIIEHNTIIGPPTGGNSCITMDNTAVNVTINNNRLRSAYWLVYFRYFAGNSLTNNRMAEGGAGYYTNTTPPGGGTPTISGNVDDYTGEPI